MSVLGREAVLPVIWADRRWLALRRQALLPDYLPYLWLKQDRSAWLLVPAGIRLALSPGCFPCTRRRLVACMPPTTGITSAWRYPVALVGGRNSALGLFSSHLDRQSTNSPPLGLQRGNSRVSDAPWPGGLSPHPGPMRSNSEALETSSAGDRSWGRDSRCRGRFDRHCLRARRPIPRRPGLPPARKNGRYRWSKCPAKLPRLRRAHSRVRSRIER